MTVRRVVAVVLIVAGMSACRLPGPMLPVDGPQVDPFAPPPPGDYKPMSPQYPG